MTTTRDDVNMIKTVAHTQTRKIKKVTFSENVRNRMSS